MLIKFHGHATIEIKIHDKIIYIDPYLDPFRAEQLRKAYVIIVTQAGFDHCSVETIRKLVGDDTILIGTQEVASLLNGCSTVRAGEVRDFGEFVIKIFSAEPYNRQHVQGSLFACTLTEGNKTIFYSSDSKYLKSFADIKPSVMLVPVGGTFTMTAKEAAQFVSILMPEIAIPVHYGRINGTIDDALYFKELVELKRETRVVILKVDEELEV